MSRLLSPALLMLATPALAHEGLHHYPHGHPHGIEYGWIVAAACGVVGGYVLARLRGRP
ncbi:MAG: hypothetical protein ACK4GC_06990 [Paracoccaceae bacterium]